MGSLRRSGWGVLTLTVALGVTLTAAAGWAGDGADQTKGPKPEDCARLDDPQVRPLMDGRLLQLLIGCGRSDELGLVRSEPAMDTGIEVGSDVAVSDPSGDSGSSHTQSETSQAINEVTGTICAGYNDSYHGVVTGQGYSGFSRSVDGGASYTDQGALTAGNYGDPALVWRKSDGHFYFATLGESGLRLYKSTDDCASFQLVGNISYGGSDDKELMAVDNNPASAYYGRLYVVWTNFSADSRIWETHSSDGGATWSTGRAISSSNNVQGSWPVVAPDGTVYAAWVEFGGTMAIRVSKSTDGGVTWTAVTPPASGKVQPQDATATSTCFRASLKGNIRYLPSPQLAVGPDGALHCIYTYDPDGGGPDTVDVFYRRSSDGGATWQTEVRLNDDATTTDQFFPTLAVGASNVVSAGWYDRRNDPNNVLVDYYQAFSFDGGVTWEANERISDVSSPIYLDPNLAGCYHGDYDTQVMSTSFAHLQWSDDRRLQGGHNDPDVFADTQAVSTDFLVLTNPGVGAVCAPDDAVFTVDVPQFLGFSETVSFTVDGVPSNGVAAFDPPSLTPPGATTLTISNTAAVAAGTSVITVTGTSSPGGVVHDDEVSLMVFTQAAGAVDPTSPADGSFNQPLRPTFEWTAGVQAASYTIEVATDAAFTNIVASDGGLTGTGFTPTLDLASNTEHFWRVRAANSCGSSTDSATFSFYTQALAGDCGFGTTPVVAFEDDLEAGAAGWTHDGSGDTWALSGTLVHSGVAAFHADDVDSISDQRLISPPIVLPNTAGGLTLQFWNHQELEDAGAGSCFDGAMVEISSNGGTSWTQLLDAVLLTDPYDGPISSSYGNPLAGLSAWCGDPQDWLRSVVDLSAYAGETVQLRFRLGTDISVNGPGWAIDDVRIQSCEVVSTDIFADGFETGDSLMWSATNP